MRVLIVEDDGDIRRSVAESLRANGFAADEAGSIAAAEFSTSVNDYDVVVVDRGLPDGDGSEFVASRRSNGDSTPTLFLTARDSVDDKVNGFQAGGDDYLVKPFAMAELLVRVRALGRRGANSTLPRIRVGGIEIDRARAEVRHDGVLIALTSKERCILSVLAGRVGTALSRSELIEHCWDEAHDPMSNVVDVHIASLRRKLGPGNPIRTIRGVGFLLDVDTPAT